MELSLCGGGRWSTSVGGGVTMCVIIMCGNRDSAQPFRIKSRDFERVTRLESDVLARKRLQMAKNPKSFYPGCWEWVLLGFSVRTVHFLYVLDNAGTVRGIVPELLIPCWMRSLMWELRSMMFPARTGTSWSRSPKGTSGALEGALKGVLCKKG